MGGGLQEELEAFISESGIDEGAADQLRAESDRVVQSVLEKGIRPGARNPSALVVSLIKRIRDGPAAEAGPHYPEDDDGSGRDAIEAFLASHRGFDDVAMEALRAQGSEVARRVLDRGPFDTARNPSALLMAAIKDAKREWQDAKRDMQDAKREMQDKLPPPARPSKRQSLEDFIAAHELDEETQELLYDQHDDIVRFVLEQSPESGRIKGGTILALIRKAQQGRRPPMDLDTYVRESGIDTIGADVLRAQSEEVIQTILEEGIIKGRNPSALLMARIKRINNGDDAPADVNSLRRPIGGAPVGASPGQMQSSQGRSRLDAEIRQFAEDSGVDEEAEEQLRSQSREVIQTILDEGILEGRNPSALLVARIRQLSRGGDRHAAAAAAERWAGSDAPPHWASSAPPPPRQQRQQQSQQPRNSGSMELQAFVRESGIDAEAEDVLRAQSPAVIDAILQEGLMKGRNPSALLMARIRQISSQIASSGDDMRGARGPSRVGSAERALAGSLEELADVAWDGGASEAEFEDAVRRVQSARRALLSATGGDPEPSRKRRREEEERPRPSRMGWERGDSRHDLGPPRRQSWEWAGSWDERHRRR